MLHTIFDFIMFFLFGIMLVTGLVALVYGLYGTSVQGFSRSVRNFSLVSGIILTAIAAAVFFSYLLN